jgi:hypothetical protein
MELNVNGSIADVDGRHTTTFTGNRVGRLPHRKSGPVQAEAGDEPFEV